MTAQRFFELFKGLDRAHGKYMPRDAVEGEKVKGSVTTERTAPTVELWERHLQGLYGLGIIPIQDTAKVAWGAIDIDVYQGLDLTNLVKEIAILKLPLVVARSKSGGAHLYLFLKEDTKASLVQGRLMEFAVALGYGGVEIYPKQVKLANENDVGNWLNMPYFAGDLTTRYVLDDRGESLEMERFLVYADLKAIDEETLVSIVIEQDQEVGEMLEEGPPCLQSLAVHGFPDGTRNASLFNFGVYLRKRFDDSWQEKVDAYNQRFMNPPLGAEEVQTITKSLKRKNYSYKCNDQPICMACSKQICLTRKFGVGGAKDDPGVAFGNLVKINTTEPYYIWDVDGIRMELEPDDLLSQHRFRKCVMIAMNKITNLVKESIWDQLLRDKMDSIEVVEPPMDITEPGQLREYLHTFILQRSSAQEIDELLLGRPYINRELNLAYFRSSDFLAYLLANRVYGVTQKKLYKWLRDNGAINSFAKMKGRGVNYWAIEAPEEQDQEFTIPETIPEYEL